MIFIIKYCTMNWSQIADWPAPQAPPQPDSGKQAGPLILPQESTLSGTPRAGSMQKAHTPSGTQHGQPPGGGPHIAGPPLSMPPPCEGQSGPMPGRDKGGHGMGQNEQHGAVMMPPYVPTRRSALHMSSRVMDCGSGPRSVSRYVAVSTLE